MSERQKHLENVKIQTNANTIQEEMIKEIKTNNEVTSKHRTAIRWLTGCIVVLGILTIWTNYNKTGRYVISSVSEGTVYVLDTKTSQLWGRTADKFLNMGTIKKPLCEVMEIDEEKRISKREAELEAVGKALDRAVDEFIKMKNQEEILKEKQEQ